MIVGCVFCLFLYFYPYVESSRTWKSPRRIIGGEPANITDFPYQLSLELFNVTTYDHICGASIIHHSWALTAAHCVKRFSERDLRLRSGSSYMLRGGTLHYVSNIVIHPKFRTGWFQDFDYDVAVIKVSTPFQYSNVAQKILMASETPSSGTLAVVSGWGGVNYEQQMPDQLQQLAVYTMEHEDCKLNNSMYLIFLSPRMLCAGVPEGGKNAFYGDSGGPLVVDNILVGVVSFSVPFAIEYPTAYTDVAKMSTWVISNIEEEFVHS